MKNTTTQLRSCKIIVGRNLINTVGSIVDLTKHSNAVIVTDSNVPETVVNTVASSVLCVKTVLILPPGEEHKNISGVQTIWNELHKSQCDRASVIITVGGGVVSDLGGFAASTFMRGVDVVHIPTTLLAQADASIGGKTAINFSGVKNQIGTFHPPIAVIADIDTLRSLPIRQLQNGMAEIIKHGLIADSALFRLVVSKQAENWTPSELINIITQSIRLKANIITSDEREKGTRKLLNFGHTVGHAIEAFSLQFTHPILHGEAVLLGMIVETRVSEANGLLSSASSKLIQHALLKFVDINLLQKLDISAILRLIDADKKSLNGEVEWTLLTDIGRASINHRVDARTIQHAII